MDRCLIAHPAIQVLPVTGTRWPHDDHVTAVASGTGDVVAFGDGEEAPIVRERAAGREFQVPADGFWQVHPAAAQTLVGTVLELLQPRPGERAWDLYGGVGLFAAALVPIGPVVLVESDRAAAELARVNVPEAQVVRSPVERFVPPYPPDLVVLDPPRTGAGAAVVRSIVAARPRAVAYVACDPASFARDVATFREKGWQLTALRAFDAFPMTHHVECVGLLVRSAVEDV